MTEAARHSRPPLRRSSTPERILTAGLATATCIGVVGLLGVRTIEANAASAETGTTVDLAASPADATVVTTSKGLTEAQLDEYAADLAREKERLDAYRAKLVKTAKKLQRQADRQAAADAATGTRSVAPAPANAAAAPQPAAKPQPVAKPKPAAKPQPVAKPAPKPAPAPAPKPAPKPQSNTKGS
jgi:hypothetical protein